MYVPKILAIDPGTRYIGVAILQGSDLLYTKVKIIRHNETPGRIFHYGKEIVRDLIKEFAPNRFAIERPFVFRSSAALVRSLTDELVAEATQAGLSTYQYFPTTIRSYLCGRSDATKRDVAGVVAKTFPQLSLHLDPFNEADERYYSHIFDAVAVGLMCQIDLDMYRGQEAA